MGEFGSTPHYEVKLDLENRGQTDEFSFLEFVGLVTSVGYNVAGELTSMSGQYSETRGYNSLFQLTSLQAPCVSMT